MVRRLIGGIWIIFAKLGGGVQIFFGFHPLFGKLIHFLRFFFSNGLVQQGIWLSYRQFPFVVPVLFHFSLVGFPRATCVLLVSIGCTSLCPLVFHWLSPGSSIPGAYPLQWLVSLFGFCRVPALSIPGGLVLC